MAKTNDTRVMAAGRKDTGDFQPGELTEIRVVPSSNGGATVHHSRLPQRTKRGVPMIHDYAPSKPATFSSHGEAVQHVHELLGGKGKFKAKAMPSDNDEDE